MKKLLLILPLSVLMTYAWAQNPDTDKKMSNTNTLDGRSFKITMSSSETSMKEHSAGQVTTTTPDNTRTETTYDQTTTGKTDNPDQNPNYDSQNKMHDKESMSNKSTILRFENGSIQSSFMSMKGLDKCPYTITKASASETISFSATCTKNASSASSSAVGSKENCTWNGTVDGKNISGTLNVIKDDGKNISYTFSGTETDGSKDLGLK